MQPADQAAPRVGRRVAAAARRWAESFSYMGLALGTLFFAASLTPSLLPRHFVVQGALSGIALAVGYAIGAALVLLWRFLELPAPAARWERIGKRATAIAVAIVAVGFLLRATVWQNSIRRLMEMPDVETAYPLRVAVIALLTAALLIATARGLGWCRRWVDGKLRAVAPRRVSYALSALVVALAVFLVVNDVFARLALNAADAMFLELDRYVDEGVPQPTRASASGSAESLIPWDTIGRQGKAFITNGPTQQDISKFSGREAEQPLRVYVGLLSRETPEERAELALEELKRVGAFDRSTLVVATPTGTGWLDPGAVDTLEYLHGGDTAIVSMQYSYLPSWITILVDPQRSNNEARALFDAIYGYWTTLPRNRRPKLYVHGLSLGSLGSETSADMFTIFEDPIQGGVWSGPPFPSVAWNRATRYRNPGSPLWLPTFRDGSLLRFTAREDALGKFGDRWGPMRFVYIQHASDPMIFFSTDLAWRSPGWLAGERGPDVSPYLRWHPIITFLQVGFDLPMATSVPTGYGHNYAPESYIDAWIAVSDPPDWTAEDTRRLKAAFAKREAARP